MLELAQYNARTGSIEFLTMKKVLKSHGRSESKRRKIHVIEEMS